MVQRTLTAEQRRLLQQDLRNSASGPTRSQQVQAAAQQSAIDRGLDDTSIRFGAGSLAGQSTLPGELSGQQKLVKDRFMQAGGTSETGFTSANQFASSQISKSGATTTPEGFEFLNRQAPKQGATEDSNAFKLRQARFDAEQFRAQANAIGKATIGIRGAQEQQQAAQTQDLFKERSTSTSGPTFKPVEVRNDAFDRLTAEEKKFNAQLPENEQVKEFLTFDESQLTDKQREAQKQGINIMMSPEQRRQLQKEAKATAGARTFIDPESGKEVTASIKKQMDRMREFLEAEDGDVIDIDKDGNFVLKDEEGELVDPVQRAEDKLQKTVKREREQMQEQQKAQVDQIYSLHTMENGQLSSQGKRALDKLQNRQNRQTEAFEENVDNALDRTIRAEKKRQFAVEDRLNAIKANENDPLKQLEKRNKQEKADYINRERAKDPTQTVEFLVDKWNKINTYDAKGDKQKRVGARIDSIIGMNLPDTEKFAHVYEAAGQDVEEATKAFKSRFGEAVAKRMQEEFLEAKGWGEKQIKTLDYKQKINGYLTGEITDPIELSGFVKQMEEDNASAEFKESALKSIAFSPNASAKVQSEALAHLDEILSSAKIPDLQKKVEAGLATPKEEAAFLRQKNKIAQAESLSGFFQEDFEAGTLEDKAAKQKESLISRIRANRVSNTEIPNIEQLALSQGWVEEFQLAVEDGKVITEKEATAFEVPSTTTKGELDRVVRIRKQKGLGNRKFQSLSAKDYSDLEGFVLLESQLQEIKDLNDAFEKEGGSLHSLTDTTFGRAIPRVGEFVFGTPPTKELKLFRKIQALTGEKLADYIKSISGAAVSDQEFKRLAQNKPNVDMTSDQFKDQLDRMIEEYDFSVAAKLKRYGFNNFDEMKDSIQGGFEQSDLSPESIDFNNDQEFLDEINKAKEATGMNIVPTQSNYEKFKKKRDKQSRAIGIDDIVRAETKGLSNPFVRTKVRGEGENKSSAYGPAQITKTLAADYRKRKKALFGKEELDYLDKFIKQGEKFLSATDDDPVYGLGASGEDFFLTEEAKSMYNTVAQKIWNDHVKRAEGDTLRAAELWRGVKRGEDPRYFTELTNEG